MIASMTTTPHPPSREQLLYWLHEASEIEHHLMCCYLYAAFSLKRVEPRWTPAQRASVQRWRQTILSVAYEEMTHLTLVCNLVNALGGSPHVNRPPFPIDAGPYPAGFVIRLQPFSEATIEHFMFLERPSTQTLSDAAGFAPPRDYQRAIPAGRLSPGPRDYATVGELYDVLTQSLEACCADGGEAQLFIGDPARQVDATLAPLPGVIAVTDLASARQAIATIVTQGEGAGHEVHDSHFQRFAAIGMELAAHLAADASFEPAWPAATNPVMNTPIHSSAERVHINEPRIAQWLDIGNALYTTSLRCLLQGFAATTRAEKASWLTASFALMRSLVPVGQGLASRPATTDVNGPYAGLTFTPLRTLARLPEPGAAQFVAERLGQLRQRAMALPLALVAGESAESWQAVINLLAAQQAALSQLTGDASAASADAPLMRPPTASTPAVPAETKIEVAQGRAVTVLFEAKRCIHSRHCVLDAPSVFKANTPGEWIYPDTVSAEALVGVAHSCPSGAIRYMRNDGGADETAPAVNQLRIRENGPYAIHAPLTLAGRDDGFRATLCRCGQSANKPWCDGSHNSAGFAASGEPKSGSVEPLSARDGPLQITPLRNGPLQVLGNLEICAGTGRTVARVTEAKLCRCGQSKNKPFCDLSHIAAGFTAEGD
jgi:CDGSH-type Zn-finger protein/uncharacterized Fe-S cluster protein YjdI